MEIKYTGMSITYDLRKSKIVGKEDDIMLIVDSREDVRIYIEPDKFLGFIEKLNNFNARRRV